MPQRIAFRAASIIGGCVLCAAPSIAPAQQWAVDGGVAARGEYTDNYFFTADNRQSAFTGSITPFVTAARRTETSDVAAIFAVGANKVWGVSPATDYVSGRAGVEASLRDVRSTWTGGLSFVRTPSLQTELGGAGVLGLAYTNSATAGGGYTYALTENVSLGATVAGYSNHYSSVGDTGTFSNSRGVSVGGSARYAHSERTLVTISTDYLHDSSGTARSDAVTATVGVAHQISPQLTLSVSAGGYWIDTAVSSLSAVVATHGHATGGLFGGHIAYDLSERSQFTLGVAETVAPSGVGVLSRSDNAGMTLTHRFSDRLTGRLGAAVGRTTFPQAASSSSDNDHYQAEIGVTYLLAERWTMEAGYRHATVRYSGNASEPRSNAAFVGIAYNWPGTSFTNWVGSASDTRAIVGAGPLALPEQETTPRPGSSPDRPSFDQFPIP